MTQDARDPAVPVSTRRQFLKVTGSASVALALGLDVVLADGRLVIPNAEGFLVVDMKKCQGCSTCMMACSLAHVGPCVLQPVAHPDPAGLVGQLARRHLHGHVPAVRERAVRRGVSRSSR